MDKRCLFKTKSALVGLLTLQAVSASSDEVAKNAEALNDPPTVSWPATSELLVRGASTVLVSSTDVPVAIPDNDPAGITSTLQGVLISNITDVNLIFDELLHTCVPDLTIALTSPSGTTAELIFSFVDDGIFAGLGCPANFIGTILDDQAPTNLASGSQPFTGSFNVEHSSVVTAPLSQFNGEDAQGTWTLFIADMADADIGTLNAWSLEVSGDRLYTISGNVAGLEGSGLVLQNNGGDDLAIAANGDFTFNTALADGSEYNVTVLEQPEDPLEVCVVEDGSGIVGAGDIDDVQVNCEVRSPEIFQDRFEE